MHARSHGAFILHDMRPLSGEGKQKKQLQGVPRPYHRSVVLSDSTRHTTEEQIVSSRQPVGWSPTQSCAGRFLSAETRLCRSWEQQISLLACGRNNLRHIICHSSQPMALVQQKRLRSVGWNQKK